MSDDQPVLLQSEQEDQKKYRRSKWWIEHRDGLRRLGLFLFACVDGLILLFVIWTFADAYLVSYADETQATLEMVAYGQTDLRSFSLSNAAKDLKTSTAIAVPSVEGKFDFYTTVTNPNNDWWAEFSYSFSSTAGETEPQHAYALPGVEKPLVAYATVSSATPRSVSLEITDLVWHRIDHHDTGDVAVWTGDRLQMQVNDPVFDRIEIEGETIGRVTFSLTNNSAFSYYDPTITVMLTRGPAVVGVTGTVLHSIDAGETQDISLNWFGTIPAVTQVEVFPDVNPFDIASYKPLQGESTEDTRTRVLTR